GFPELLNVIDNLVLVHKGCRRVVLLGGRGNSDAIQRMAVKILSHWADLGSRIRHR
ncbi:MAG: hypothetical protein ACI9R8_002811, partial [Candidatus Paceibacteria bacterium]